MSTQISHSGLLFSHVDGLTELKVKFFSLQPGGDGPLSLEFEVFDVDVKLSDRVTFSSFATNTQPASVNVYLNKANKDEA